MKTGGDWRKTGYRFCCSRRPNKRFVSAANEMIVIFDNDGGSPKRGFKARVTADGYFALYYVKINIC